MCITLCGFFDIGMGGWRAIRSIGMIANEAYMGGDFADYLNCRNIRYLLAQGQPERSLQF